MTTKPVSLKRVFSLLLCAVMLLCMLPTAVSADNPAALTPVTAVNVSFPETAGNPVDFTPEVAATPSGAVSVSHVSWQDNDSFIYERQSPVLTAGHTYKFSIELEVSTGYSFDFSTIVAPGGYYKYTGSAKVNAYLPTNAYRFNSEGTELRIEYSFTCREASTYTVSFDANGGSGTMAAVTNAPTAYNFPLCGFTAPAGQRFKGWSYSRTGGTVTGTSVNVTENIILYAIWEIIPTHTVSFDANGGSGWMSGVAVLAGSYTLPACGFTAPAGRVFKGWGWAASVFEGNTIQTQSVTIDRDNTLYAIWESPINAVSVTGVPTNSGSPINLFPSYTFGPDGAVATLKSCDWYWLDSISGSNDWRELSTTNTLAEGARYRVVIALSGLDGYYFTFGDGATMPFTGTVTVNGTAPVSTLGSSGNNWLYITYEFTATAQDTDYTVSFDPNGGVGTMTAVNNPYRNYTLPSCEFTAPEGMRFKGWATATNLSTIAESYLQVNSNITLYAMWENIPDPHTHSWSSAWNKNSTHHWHECEGAGTCGITDNSLKDGYGEHVYDDVYDADCNTCGHLRSVAPRPHTHSWASAWSKNSTHHWHECEGAGVCGITDNSAKNGYGEHVYDDVYDADCNTCGHLRSVTPPAPPRQTIVLGMNGVWSKGGSSGLSFTSDAAFADFLRVEVDGVTIPNTAFTVAPGSTIVVLTAQYLETLSAGSYTIGIVSTTGTAETGFTVNASTDSEAHTHSYVVKRDSGFHWEECACGEIKNKQAHSFGEWKVITQPTADKEGEKQRSCSVCLYTQTAKVPALTSSTSPSEEPRTGGSGNTALPIALMVISGLAVLVACRRKEDAE